MSEPYPILDTKLMAPTTVKKVSSTFAVSHEMMYATATPIFDWAEMCRRSQERQEIAKRRGKRTLIYEEPLTMEQNVAINRARALLKALEGEYARPDTFLEYDVDGGYYLPEEIHGKRTYRYENGEEETV